MTMKYGRIVLFSLLVMYSVSVPLATLSQEGSQAAIYPKVGVVLSGGGARGFAHIGALKVLEEIGLKIGKEAIDFAIHAGRKTVKSEDIDIAAKKVHTR